MGCRVRLQNATEPKELWPATQIYYKPFTPKFPLISDKIAAMARFGRPHGVRAPRVGQAAVPAIASPRRPISFPNRFARALKNPSHPIIPGCGRVRVILPGPAPADGHPRAHAAPQR